MKKLIKALKGKQEVETETVTYRNVKFGRVRYSGNFVYFVLIKVVRPNEFKSEIMKLGVARELYRDLGEVLKEVDKEQL